MSVSRAVFCLLFGTMSNSDDSDIDQHQAIQKGWIQASSAAVRSASTESKPRLSALLNAHWGVLSKLVGKWPNKISNMSSKPLIEKKECSQPASVTGGIMKSYQLAGLAFMRYMHDNGAGAIMGDEVI